MYNHHDPTCLSVVFDSRGTESSPRLFPIYDGFVFSHFTCACTCVITFLFTQLTNVASPNSELCSELFDLVIFCQSFDSENFLSFFAQNSHRERPHAVPCQRELVLYLYICSTYIIL